MTEPTEKRDLKKQRILVIDDEAVVCLSCSQILSPEGYQIECYQDPQKGLKAALSGNFDIILLDIVMPKMEGMEILKILKEEGISSEVVIITGYSTVQNAVEAMKCGAIDYVSKPFTPDELRLVISRIFERSALIQENVALRRQLESQRGLEGILGESALMESVFKLIQRVAPLHATVLISGESGTGKEMVAQAIHRLSPRREKPFVVCDTTSLASTLLESELFGHIKGSFSGAFTTKQGLFEVAGKGSLFLDEVANINLETQGKLLRVLETRKIKKVGDTAEREIDIRLIAATNKNLQHMVENGSFREDLFYRLNVVPIEIPPLRERSGDIPRLSMAFLERCRENYKVPAQFFSPEALHLMENYSWPGNVRELKNVVEQIAINCDDKWIQPSHLPHSIRPVEQKYTEETDLPKTWKELKYFKQEIFENLVNEIEKKFVIEALNRSKGNVTQAAQEVQMQRTNFHALMRKFGLRAGPPPPTEKKKKK